MTTRTLIHIETGFTLDLVKYANADITEIAQIIKDELDIRIGRISLNNLIQGNVQCANGFEVVVGDAEDKPAETVSEDKPEDVTEAVVEDKPAETVSEDKPEDVTEAVVEDKPEDVTEAVVEDTELGGSFAADLVAGKMGTGSTQKEFTETNKRRHNKKELAMDEARKHSVFGVLIEGLEALGVTFNYSQPDLRWFELVINASVTEDNVSSRKNPYIDVAPRKNGSIGVSLYLGGKSATKRTVFSESGDISAVASTITGVAAMLAEGGEYDLLIKG